MKRRRYIDYDARVSYELAHRMYRVFEWPNIPYVPLAAALYALWPVSSGGYNSKPAVLAAAVDIVNDLREARITTDMILRYLRYISDPNYHAGWNCPEGRTYREWLVIADIISETKRQDQ